MAYTRESFLFGAGRFHTPLSSSWRLSGSCSSSTKTFSLKAKKTTTKQPSWASPSLQAISLVFSAPSFLILLIPWSANSTLKVMSLARLGRRSAVFMLRLASRDYGLASLPGLLWLVPSLGFSGGSMTHSRLQWACRPAVEVPPRSSD